MNGDALLAMLIAGVIVIALNAYVLLGGADFGGGVWDLLASGPRREEQRDLIAHAIGPIWEANHVWLILVVVLLFTCFPSVFARLAITLHIPLSLMLIGIVLRGAGLAFRTYGRGGRVERGRWGHMFAIASLLTPALLGLSLGALMSGSLPVDRAAPASSFVTLYLAHWLSPFALGAGAMALAACAMLAAVYASVEARDAGLRDDFRRRALGSTAVLVVLAIATLVAALRHAPRLGDALTGQSAALPIAIAAMLAAIVTVLSLLGRRFSIARIAAAVMVSCLLWGWAVASFPYLIPGQVTILDAAAPPATLRAVSWALVAGVVVLTPSMWMLYGLFGSANGRANRRGS